MIAYFSGLAVKFMLFVGKHLLKIVAYHRAILRGLPAAVRPRKNARWRGAFPEGNGQALRVFMRVIPSPIDA